MKECSKVKRLLSRYLDKEMAGSGTELVEAHLERCSFCRQELSELSRMKGIILGRERKTLPPDYLVCRLRREIAGQRYSQESLLVSGMARLCRRLIPIPMAAIVLSIVLLVLCSRPQQESGYSLEDNILSGTPVTTQTALALLLGVQH